MLKISRSKFLSNSHKFSSSLLSRTYIKIYTHQAWYLSSFQSPIADHVSHQTSRARISPKGTPFGFASVRRIRRLVIQPQLKFAFAHTDNIHRGSTGTFLGTLATNSSSRLPSSPSTSICLSDSFTSRRHQECVTARCASSTHSKPRTRSVWIERRPS